MIETKELGRKFGDLTAVENLSLNVNEGEVLGFLGPNGAGKTTTIRMLSCLIRPTWGEATINGLDIGRDDHEIRQIVGIQTESPGFYEKLSVKRNLEFFSQLYSVTDADKKMDGYLSLFDLKDRLNSPVSDLSKGMKQKLALARALMHDPKVLFLDEPTSALDPEAAKTVREFIKELSTRGRTIFLSTHNLAEAEFLSDRIAVFSQRIIAIDTPKNLRSQLFIHKTLVKLESLDDSYRAELRGLDFIHNVDIIDNSFIIELAQPEKHIPDVVDKLVSLGARIQQVSDVEHSLEEIYTTLINEEKEMAS
ncbi:MAG: ABC transporter ATP-binding protein [Anaerolineales bacterium]|nr:ABC transporter ATP-binding protein [Anaerolineales bacterium]